MLTWLWWQNFENFKWEQLIVFFSKRFLFRNNGLEGVAVGLEATKHTQRRWYSTRVIQENYIDLPPSTTISMDTIVAWIRLNEFLSGGVFQIKNTFVHNLSSLSDYEKIINPEVLHSFHARFIAPIIYHTNIWKFKSY